MSLVCSVPWIEWEYIDCRWTEHCKFQVVRDNPSIIHGEATLESNSIHVFIILLLRLARPRKGKSGG